MSIQSRSHNHIGVETSSKIGTYPTLFQHLTGTSNCLTKSPYVKCVLERVEHSKVWREFEGSIWPSSS
jgi:hypothetical protein